MWTSPYGVAHFAPHAQAVPEGPACAAVRAWARELGVTLVGGSLPERRGGHLHNTSLTAGPGGEVLAVHRKLHLFDIDVPGGITFRESDALSAGHDVTTFDIPGTGVTAGVGICYDIRFPELSALMAKKG